MNFHSMLFSNGNVPRSTAYAQGKYGRLFPALPAFATDTPETRAKLLAIASKSRFYHKNGSLLPAGYTYLGQFIAHDITFDTTSIAQRQVDPEQLTNFRTPALDLDSVYGGGPFVHPMFYEPAHLSVRTEFLVEPNDWKNQEFWDLPRLMYRGKKMERTEALVADPRNDENLILSQLHVAFLLLHNHFYQQEVSKLNPESPLNWHQKIGLFNKAQQLTRWHYQYVVLHDYLPRIVSESLVISLVKDECGRVRRQFFDWRNEPFIPLEFSAAAFRFGHSQVRGSYDLNAEHDDVSIFNDPAQDRQHPPRTYVDWSRFFELHNSSRHVTTIITNQLNPLPAIDVTTAEEKNLYFRNLLKGLLLELPSGQSIAKAMRLKPLTVEEEGFPPEFKEHTPLWFYILYEAGLKQQQARDAADAEVLATGRRSASNNAEATKYAGILGPVGSRIVAEVLIGLLEGDKNSFLHQDPNWEPEIVRKKIQTTYTMKDLLEEAGIYRGALIEKPAHQPDKQA